MAARMASEGLGDRVGPAGPPPHWSPSFLLMLCVCATQLQCCTGTAAATEYPG